MKPEMKPFDNYEERISGCALKKTLSEQAAHGLAAKILRERGVKQRPYRCQFCSSWHLTTVKANQNLPYKWKPKKAK